VGYLQIGARRHSDVGTDRLQAELGVLNSRYREENPKAPDADPDVLMTATSLRQTIISDERGKILIRSIAVAVVLLIACANVAGLLLSRGLSRRREIAVRIALGARRSLIVRQLLTESVLQAFMAGILGVGLGWAATLDLVWWGGNRPTQGIPIVMDVRVLLFTIALSLLTGIAFGIFPALQLSRADLNSALREEARGASVGHARMRLTSLLVVGQVALSLLLLIVAGLLLRSFSRLLRVDPGFDGRNVLVMNVSLPTAKYAKGGDQIAFFDELLRRVSSVPGAQNAAVSAALPLTIKRITPVLPEGLPDTPLPQRPFIDIEAVSPLWFRTMRVPVRMGREFTAADNADAPKAAIVNDSFARRFWPNQNPIGNHIAVGRWPQPAEVVGVVGDVKNRGLALDPAPQLYLPFPQLPWGNMNLLVRTGVAPLSLAQAVRAQIASLDPDQPVTDIQIVDDLLDESRAESRSAALSLGMLAATALLLAMIGIYSMLAYSVEQRRQEIGVRIALGADRPDIMRLIVGRGLILSAIGIAIGLAAALPATRLISGMLYKVSALDPVTFVLGPPIFFFTALLAGFIPARRATKVAPTEALRES
jgi:putative ABC transport system permease protein